MSNSKQSTVVRGHDGPDYSTLVCPHCGNRRYWKEVYAGEVGYQSYDSAKDAYKDYEGNDDWRTVSVYCLGISGDGADCDEVVYVNHGYQEDGTANLIPMTDKEIQEMRKWLTVFGWTEMLERLDRPIAG